jgi:ubiquinone/menaquinone biosynthesis C-methylase UbiE
MDHAADPRIRLFDRVARVYGFWFHAQRLAFRKSFRALRGHLALPGRARILDIGCGTAAQASVLMEKGHEVWAVDASPRMIATARRLLRRSGFGRQAEQLAVGNPLRGLAFPDRHFDLVLAAHVLHGMRQTQRRRFYREARRVARGRVLFYDYSPEPAWRPGPVVRALEALERSDYRRFRRSGLGELRESFAQVEVLLGATGSAWYLCRP